MFAAREAPFFVVAKLMLLERILRFFFLSPIDDNIHLFKKRLNIWLSSLLLVSYFSHLVHRIYRAKKNLFEMFVLLLKKNVLKERDAKHPNDLFSVGWLNSSFLSSPLIYHMRTVIRIGDAKSNGHSRCSSQRPLWSISAQSTDIKS